MPEYRYSFKVQENMAQAVGRNLPISTKHSIEICKFVRGKSLEEAKKMLEDVTKKKRAVPFTRFNRDVGHKTKIGPGRYPISACAKILGIIESAEANAQFKGLSTTSMIVRHISAQRAARNMRWGRRGRQGKNTIIEVVLEEEKVEEKKVRKKEVKKQEKKAGSKKVEKKAEPKPKEVKKEEQKAEKAEVKEETKAEEK